MTEMKVLTRRLRFILGMAVAAVLFLSVLPAGAQEDLKPQTLEDQALVTLNKFQV